MNKKSLEKTCKERFGEKRGCKLFQAMLILSEIDFCVASAWHPDQVSLARSCSARGKIFHLSQNYRSLLLPNNKIIPINEVTYNELTNYLPPQNPRGELKHCHFDSLY